VGGSSSALAPKRLLLVVGCVAIVAVGTPGSRVFGTKFEPEQSVFENSFERPAVG